jgi:hypothetical protein
MVDGFFHVLPAIGVLELLEEAHGAALPRARVALVQDVLLYGVKTLFGLESLHALPHLWFSEAARMQLVGCKAPQVRQGLGPRGATTRQGERRPGPSGPDTLAKHIVRWKVRDLEAVCHGAIRALAQAGVFRAKVTGMADGTALETTEHYPGGGQVTRTVRIAEKRGRVPESAVTVYGGNVRRLIDAATKRPLAVKGGQMQAPEALWTRALVTQARLNLQGSARRHKIVFAQGFLAGPRRWWWDPHESTCVVPAKTHLAVTAEARAQAAADAGRTIGRRVHTVRPGQGRAARTARLEPAVVGRLVLTTDDLYGTPEHGRQAHRGAFQANPIHAVVVRTWQGKDDGPGGTTVFLTKAPVEQPWRVFDDDDDRSRIDNWGIKDAKQPWELGHPPPQPDRAVRGHVVFTLRLFALATASRRPGERAATGGEPVGWQRWRRPLLEQTRDPLIGFAQGCYGSFQRAEDSLLRGVQRKDTPPGLGPRSEVLATYRLIART